VDARRGQQRGRWLKLEDGTWGDTRFASLGTDARLLFIWALTPPNAAIGLFSATEAQLGLALGASPLDATLGRKRRVWDALDELRDRDMVKYDAEQGVVFVIRRMEHQRVTQQNIGLFRAEVKRVPPSPLVDEFLYLYGSRLSYERGEDDDLTTSPPGC